MNWTCPAESIVPVVNLCLQTVEKKDPVRSNIKIKAAKGGVDFLASSFTSGTCATLEGAKIKNPGELMVNAENFARSVRACDGDIEFSVKNNNLKMICGNKEYQHITSASESFPFHEQNNFDTYIVNQAELHEAIRLCVPAVKTIRAEEFKGIVLETRKGRMRISALDRKSAAGSSVIIKTKSKDIEAIIASSDFADCLSSLGAKDQDIGIGIQGGLISISHKWGYSYFPLLNGKPYDVSKITDKLPKCECLCVAGLLTKTLRSVLVMGDSDDGSRGKIKGVKGAIEITCHTNEVGAARDKVITAGDFKAESWYNIQSLLSYVSKVDPEQEIALGAFGDEKPALIIKHGQATYWLAACEPPNDD